MLLAVPDGVPEEWVQGVADLLVMPAHPDWKGGDWHTLQEDALRFVREWAGQARRLGWESADLFGAHPTKPRVRFDCAGLVVLLQGRPVVAITEDSAAIKTASGGSLTFRKRAAPPAEQCLIWERQGVGERLADDRKTYAVNPARTNERQRTRVTRHHDCRPRRSGSRGS